MTIVEVEDQASRLKRLQKTLMQRSILLEKKSSNKEKAKNLYYVLHNLKEASLKINSELDQLYIKKAALEKELEAVNADISKKEQALAPISNSTDQKKKELVSIVAEGKIISKDLKTIPEVSEDDEKLIAHVEAIRIAASSALRNFFNV